MIKAISLSLPIRDNRLICALRLLLLSSAFALLFFAQRASSQYSTRELTNSTLFPAASQNGVGKPIATDGTYVAYSTAVSLWSQTVAGSKPKRIFASGDVLPKSDSRVKLIYPQVVVTNGYVVFLATDGGGGETGLFGLYSIKADGSEPATRVMDSTIVSSPYNWSADMDPYAYSWPFQASHGVAVIALEGVLYSADLNGENVKTLWATSPSGFKGCESGGAYKQIFLTNSAYFPATNGTSYAFAGGSTLEFTALLQGPLSQDNSCDELMNSQISNDFNPSQALKTLPGQPAKAGPFAFYNTFQSIQIDGDYVYFGAYVKNGVSSTEDYSGFFRIPIKGGKPEVIVTNLSHLPGIVNAKGRFDEVNLMGFAVSNGRFVFMANDATPGYPGVASFYMVDGSKFVTLFSAGSSVSNSCVGALDAEYAAPGALNQVSLSASGLLTFGAEVRLATVPDKFGPCSWPQADYIFQPVGYFILDTAHPLIPTETEISLSVSQPIVYGEKPSLRITVLSAEGAKNPKDLVPTGVVSVYYTNPEYLGFQHPTPNTAKLNSDGKATISLGEQQIGAYTYVVAYGGDTNFSSSASANLVFPLHVTAPTFSIPGKTYSSAQSVYLNDSTPGSTIYYTTNGETPTKKSTKFNDVNIPVTKNETIKAIAVANGDANSTVASATYTIK
jgi:Chitobiase/beta-hexosaminidase C-terminal domain/Bacterial Ig-like domain (group 3)